MQMSAMDYLCQPCISMFDKVKQPDTDMCQGLLMWHSHIAIFDIANDSDAERCQGILVWHPNRTLLDIVNRTTV